MKFRFLISRIFDDIRRARRITFRGLGRKLKKKGRLFIRCVKARLWGTDISEQEFLRHGINENIRDKHQLLALIREGRQSRFFIHPDDRSMVTGLFRKLCPNSEQDILQAADAACLHHFDLLGSGKVPLGELIDWHTDFKTGYRWNPRQYYATIRPAPYPGGYDIKVPWELSRCQHFAWLGQAYWLTGNEQYSQEFRSEVEDWIRQNPPQYGVNWACTMDVAIRAVNWLWGYAFFRQSPLLDDDFHLLLYRSLLIHGRHIMDNLEWSERLTTNHYLANIVGLIYLGFLLPELREAHRWRQFGLEELEKEMQKQVYPDGVCFEASTNYHRLSTEMFLSAALLAEINGHRFDPAFTARLERMVEAIRLISQPDGTVPVIGDQDNGRLHRLKVWHRPEREWIDFRPLLAVGAAWKGNLLWASAAGENWEEAVWILPEQVLAIRHQAQSASPIEQRSSALPDGGWYVLQNREFHVMVEAGSVGQNGVGGHAHNDAFAFTLFCQNQSWIMDPGAYIYTQDYLARNTFRSTAIHNTVSQDGYEQNRIHPHDLFRLEEISMPRVLRWETGNGYTVFSGELRTNHLIHRRQFLLSDELNFLAITDHFSSPGRGPARVPLHFSPGVMAQVIDDPAPGLILKSPGSKPLWLFLVEPDRTRLLPGQGWISMGYGTRQACQVAVLEWEPKQPNTFIFLYPGITRDEVRDELELACAFVKRFPMVDFASKAVPI